MFVPTNSDCDPRSCYRCYVIFIFEFINATCLLRGFQDMLESSGIIVVHTYKLLQGVARLMRKLREGAGDCETA